MFATIWEMIRDAFLWCLEGLYGSLVAATHFYTDVPWYQCLFGSLAFVVPILLLEIFVFDKLREKRRMRRYKKKYHIED
jgi:hypothetical protein